MNIKQLKEFCENTPLVVHHAQFENKWLLSRGINANIVDDTMLLAYIHDERMPLDLESLCLRYDIDSIFKKEYGTDVAELTGKRLAKRNVKDAQNTIKLRDVLKVKLTEEELFVYGVLLEGTKTMAQIELEGLCYSPKAVDELLVEIGDRVRALGIQDDEYIKAFSSNIEGEFNINSAPQRSMLVYDILGYEPLPFKQAQTDSGAPSTQLKVLRKLQELNPTATLGKLIEYSGLIGWKEKYEELDKFCERCNAKHVSIDGDRGYLYSNLRMGSTSTGRIASSHINLQNLPAREGAWTRRIFTSRHDNGIILEGDYDQIELRILAGLSGDEKLLDDFARGKDPHSEMAKLAFNKSTLADGDRHLGKTLNFAIPFGSGIGRIAYETGRTMKEARVWLNRYWKEHKTLKMWLESIPESGVVRSPTGMKRHTTTWTQGRNFPIQNSAFIALIVALNRLVPHAKVSGFPVDLCIHDSIRMDVKDRARVPYIIEEVKEMIEFKAGELFSWLPIPLTMGFKSGETWGSMVDYA